VIVLRSIIFNIAFYVNLALYLILGSEFFLTPRKWSVRALQVWARSSLWLLRVICGLHIEVRGVENIPKGPVLVAGKHQSLWETFAILPYLDDPCMVLKRELSWIPVFGWFIFKFRMIRLERGAASAALRKLMARGVEELAAGRQIYAVGSNEQAARLSGVNVGNVRLFVYTLLGGLAALAGIMGAGLLSTAPTNLGLGTELDVIAAVVIGGASLAGGEGTILGAVIGAAIMAVIRNAFVLLKLPIYLQTITIGVVIIIAVALDQLRKRRT